MMTGQYAIIFPGQGSQSLGMLSSLQDNAFVRDTFSEASDILGYDVWALAQQGPEEKLNQTEFTQPALLTADIALWRYGCSQQDLRPLLLAGHSLGEYSALVAAQALSFSEAVTLVANRGQYMQEAVSAGVGAMAAIVGVADSKLLELCELARQKEEVLSPANFNSVGQTVIAGHGTAIDRVIELAKAQGAKIARRIPVSVPSHCALMEPAAERLEQDLAQLMIQSPKIPVIHNYDVSQHSDSMAIRRALIQQLTHPVRWVETIQCMEQAQIPCLIECGPGKVLAGLNKRISRHIVTHSILESNLFKEIQHVFNQ